MCRRMLAVSILATIIVGLSGDAASAGGWDSLNFPRDHYLTGDVAEVRGRFFAGELKGTGELTAGPYYAYLLPGRGWGSWEMIQPPAIPKGSIQLGTLQIDGPTVRDGYRYGVASLTFAVPDVPSGRYAIGFCDDPCVHASVGWLGMGWITIVHTPFEAALLDRLDRHRTERWRLRNQARRAVRMSTELREGLIRTRSALREAQLAPVPIPASVPVPRAASPDPTRSLSWWWPAILTLAIGALVGRWLGRRSRRVVAPAPEHHEPEVEIVREREPAEV